MYSRHESDLVSYALIPGEKADKESPRRSYSIIGKLWELAEARETQGSCSDFLQVLLSSAIRGFLSSYPIVPGTAMGEGRGKKGT